MDLLDVSLLLGSQMLVLAGRTANLDEARELLMSNLKSGAGLQILRQIISGQAETLLSSTITHFSRSPPAT